MKKRVIKICETCSNEFTVYQARSKARFCSWTCRASRPKRICVICGNAFYPKPSYTQPTCSHECGYKLAGLGRAGKPRPPYVAKKVSDGLKRYYNGDPSRHWNYQGGISHFHGRGNGWNTIKKIARERDNYTCQICGVTEGKLGKRLAVHHRIPYHNFSTPSEANALDNLICVCQSCHMKLEHGTVALPK